MKYELVLGIEIHLQLKTATGMFCSCKNDTFGAEPNTHVCPVCLGLPGALPVPNKEAIEKARLMAHALGTTLQDRIVFERKNYSYPDLPKGYQLTSPHYPVGIGGEYTILFSPRQDDDPTIRWREIHLEEDTAKSMHKEGKTWIDFNKSGVPLLEMVTEPDFHSVDQAVQFCKEIQWVARALEVSDADMEKGQMRLEANISLRETGDQKLPDYRVELKNINSFTYMKRAVEAEFIRQSAALDRGEVLVQETRGFNEGKKQTFVMRSKEDAHDYRYFPEPDIPPIIFDKPIAKLSNYQTVKLPADLNDQLIKLGVSKEQYRAFIVADAALASFVFEAIKLGVAKSIGAEQVVGYILNTKVDISNISASQIVDDLVVQSSSLVSDESQLSAWVDTAIAENPKAVEAIASGKMQAIGALIGSVMKHSKGKADAKTVQALICTRLK